MPFASQQHNILRMHTWQTIKTVEAKKIFGDNLAKKLGRVGTRPRSVEEGLIRRWSRKAADVEESGKGIYDATMALCPAAGLVTMHTHRQLAAAAIRFTGRAVLQTLLVNSARFTV